MKKNKTISNELISITLPSIFKIETDSKSLWGETRGGRFTFTVDLEGLSDDSMEYLLSTLQAPLGDNPQLKAQIIDSKAIEKPVKGWEKIVETTINGTNDSDHGISIVGESSSGVRVKIEMGGEGQYIEHKNMWNDIIESITIN